jgi:hypothetical protein
VTCAGVSAGCNHDRHGERADQDASLEPHMAWSAAWWITGTRRRGPGARRRSGDPPIAMMEPVNLRNRDDSTSWREFHTSWLRTVVVERLVVAVRCCRRRCRLVGADGGEPAGRALLRSRPFPAPERQSLQCQPGFGWKTPPSGPSPGARWHSAGRGRRLASHRSERRHRGLLPEAQRMVTSRSIARRPPDRARAGA